MVLTSMDESEVFAKHKVTRVTQCDDRMQCLLAAAAHAGALVPDVAHAVANCRGQAILCHAEDCSHKLPSLWASKVGFMTCLGELLPGNGGPRISWLL